MTDREIMQQALEALTRIWEDGLENFPVLAHEAAIDNLRERLAQPEQEPFMASYEFKQYGYYKDGKGTLKIGNIPATQPPQRTWVGLTDEEEERLIHNFGSDPHTLLDEVNARLQKRNT